MKTELESGARADIGRAVQSRPSEDVGDGPPERLFSPPPAVRSRWPFGLPGAILVVGLLVTAALVLISHSLYTSNEQRLLELRVREAGSALAQALPSIQTPLASAAELADATNGNAQKFKQFVSPYVGPGPGHPFVSLSLWRLNAPGHGPVVVAGAPPQLSASMSEAPGLFASAARTAKLSVIGLLRPPDFRLGYAFSTPGSTARFAAYAETTLPANHRSPIQRTSAFSDLDYALYLGASHRPADLLLTSVSQLPIHGRQASEVVPFGTSALTLVVASRGALAGTLPQRLPWIIAITGFVLTLGAGAVTVSLAERRRRAERLAGALELTASENRRLYAEQRTIAQTLQQALLPDALPIIAGAQASALYAAGEDGIDVGGDWYDLIELADHRLLLVVGDVSGRGLRAATTMASLRYAIHAYAAQNDAPAAILTKLSTLLSITTTRQIATVLCALVDIDSRQVTLTSAGHLPPLLIDGDRREYLDGEVGLPIGVDSQAAYSSTTFSIPSAATLVAFTDGLVERRGENLDQGLERLRQAATVAQLALPDLLDRLISEVRHDRSDDDTVIIALRWPT